MSENRPTPPDRKLGLMGPISIAIVVALVLLGTVLFRGGPHDSPPPEPAATPKPAPAPITKAPALPAVLLPEAPLGRGDILVEAQAAAAAYSVNSSFTGADPLAGRRFHLSIPFGCEGPQIRPGAAQAFYEFKPDERTVRLVARPATWTTLPLVQALKAPEIEAVQGFWIPHPWTNSEDCPKRREQPPPAVPTPPSAQTLGIAQLFREGGARTERRGERPYEHILKLGENEQPPLADGFRLVLEGRLSTFPNGRVARCWSESSDHQPMCLFAASFDRVAFESGSDGRLIAEWRN